MKKTKNKVSMITRFLVSSFIFWLILIPAFLQAKEMTETEVRSAVQTWVRHVTADARSDAVVEKMEPYLVDGAIMAYIAHLADCGFCLCGANDLVLPVYLYSPQGTYDPSIPDYQAILLEITERVRYLQKGPGKQDPILQPYQQMISDRTSFWQDLIVGRIPSRIEEKDAAGEPGMLVLDLTSTWDQHSPYNDSCPELTPNEDEHTKVGCGATALSQIMRYWEWPNTGAGSGSTIYYYRWRIGWDEEPLATDPNIPAPADSIWVHRLKWTAENGGKLRMNGYWDESLHGRAQDISSDPDYLEALETLWDNLNLESTTCEANFGATTYDWSIMQDDHTDPPGLGDAEVAKLCYHAGIAIGNEYGVGVSGAPSAQVEGRFENHFRYDTDAVYQDWDIDKMTTEILWLRPFYFHGEYPAGGGHNWVVFGYNKGTDPNREFMMNMGYGNPGAWYARDAVPDSCIYNQKHLIQIAPQNVVKFVGAAILGDGSPDDPYRDIEEAIVEAPDGATLIFKAGSDNTFSAATLTITKPLTLKGVDVVIRKE